MCCVVSGFWLVMHLHFERTTNTRNDCAILSLTWMGKVPDEIPEDDGWKLNRTNYYQEGWLASGNVRGIVGVTFTTCHCKKTFDAPLRTNYNLRGHRSEVTLVKWNEPYQKLASCDSSGIIFVWIKYEGRWSIELINDRNTQVTDFSWSHDGRMALICYQDGFVLVGSVAGQRYWSSMLNLESTITCGIWTPDDQQVFFGTTDGQIIIMDVHGTMVAQVGIVDDVAIVGMAWSCEKFKMEETDDDESNGELRNQVQSPTRPDRGDRHVVMAVCFQNGVIYIMKNYDDLSPVIIHTDLKGIKMEWSNSGEILAVSGTTYDSKPGECTNVIKFFNALGSLRYSVHVPNTQQPISAMTWGHNDKRMFVATGSYIHIAWVNRKVASLQLLCRLAIHTCLEDDNQAATLPIPRRLCTLLSSLFVQTIKCYVPDQSSLREFVSRPPVGNSRLHCTMIRHDDDLSLSSGACYTLYLEYLGGLVPLLKGKRTSKIRPEFVIYDPQSSADESSSSGESIGENGTTKPNASSNYIILINTNQPNLMSDNSDSEYEELCASPRMQRRRRQRRRILREQMLDNDRRCAVDELTYIDTLPENEKLVEVTSNIWGTKFKIHGVSPVLPANLGQVTYKTSLLHLQPRQMTLIITELRDDVQPDRDPNFNPNVFSEDEDEPVVTGDGNNNINSKAANGPHRGHQYKDSVPIAPMTPRRHIPTANGYNRVIHRIPANGPMSPLVNDGVPLGEPPARFAALAQPEVDNESSDEYPYVDFTANPELMHLMQRTVQSSGATTTSTERRSNNKTPPPPSSHSPLSIHRQLLSNITSEKMELGAVPKKNGPTAAAAAASSHVRNGPAKTEQPKSTTTNGIKKSFMGCSKKPPRWTEKSRDLKYIDDDEEISIERILRAAPSNGNHGSYYQTRLLSKYRSRSVGHLNLVDVLSFPSDDVILRAGSLREAKKRLVLSPSRPFRPRTKLQYCGKSRSLDSGIPSKDVVVAGVVQHQQHVPTAVAVAKEKLAVVPNDPPPRYDRVNHLLASKKTDATRSLEEVRITAGGAVVQSRCYNSDSASDDTSPVGSPPPASKSVSSTPTRTCKNRRPKSSSPVRKSFLNSPLLSRRSRRTKVVESSDDEVAFSGDEILTHSFKDLENFQKAQIRQKLKKGRSNGENRSSSPAPPKRREYVMHNKAPLWNENSQVYQLDFGGRVTQESAKNFQIEFKGKQVMQFGRIDGNAYTLDFQYPFTAIQAFAVALANVTQRLK